MSNAFVTDVSADLDIAPVYGERLTPGYAAIRWNAPTIYDGKEGQVLRLNYTTLGGADGGVTLSGTEMPAGVTGHVLCPTRPAMTGDRDKDVKALRQFTTRVATLVAGALGKSVSSPEVTAVLKAPIDWGTLLPGKSGYLELKDGKANDEGKSYVNAYVISKTDFLLKSQEIKQGGAGNAIRAQQPRQTAAQAKQALGGGGAVTPTTRAAPTTGPDLDDADLNF